MPHGLERDASLSFLSPGRVKVSKYSEVWNCTLHDFYINELRSSTRKPISSISSVWLAIITLAVYATSKTTRAITKIKMYGHGSRRIAPGGQSIICLRIHLSSMRQNVFGTTSGWKALTIVILSMNKSCSPHWQVSLKVFNGIQIKSKAIYILFYDPHFL